MKLGSSKNAVRESMQFPLRIARFFALLLLPAIGLGVADAAGGQAGDPALTARADRAAHMRARVAEHLATRAPRQQKGSPTTYTVDRIDDDSSPSAQLCTAALNDCTLRGALLGANAFSSDDFILFDIPGSGPHVIAIDGASFPLPMIDNAVTINGYSQAGAVQNTDPVATNALLQIVIDGAGLAVIGPNVLISGLVIQNAAITQHNGAGLYVNAAGSGRITGSFIGTDASGNAVASNCDGVWLDRVGTTSGVFEVGSEGAAQRNLISGNDCAGVYAKGDEWIIGNNLIGTNANGSGALANLDGVVVEAYCNNAALAYNNAAVGDENVISGNTDNGVLVFGLAAPPRSAEKGACASVNASGLYIGVNRIGVNASGSATLLNGAYPILIDADGISQKVLVSKNRIGLPAEAAPIVPRSPRGSGVSMPFSENFDAVSAPGLPAGWSAVNNVTGNGVFWATNSTPSPAAHSAPNVAQIDNEGVVSDKLLLSPSIAISAIPALLTFRNAYNLESTFDGMVLELAVNGGPFADAVAAGGSFLQGGYNGTLNGGGGRSAAKAQAKGSNPLGGRAAWTADSLGRLQTVYALPPTVVPGDNVQFRWRVGTDGSVSVSGASIDSITLVATPGAVFTPGVAVAAGRKRIDISENTQFNTGEGSDPGSLGSPFIDLGIDGRTANDSGDGDTGANELQNAPDIVSATLAGGNLSIDFSLDAPAGEGPFSYEFYQMTTAKAPIAFIGSHAGASPATFAEVSLVPGNRIAAISRSTSSGNTSEIGPSYQIPGAGAVGPSITYSPADGAAAGTGGPVNFTGVTTIGSTGTGTISATPNGGSGGGTTTVGSFVLSGANAANFLVTSATTLTFTEGDITPQNITLTCTAGAAARTANLQATETITGGAASPRFWVLNCPPGAAVVGPSIIFNPASSGEVGSGGPVNFTGVTTIGSTGSGTISASPNGGSNGGTTTVGSFVFSGANAANFTVISAPTLTFLAGSAEPQNIGLTCTSGAAARTANLQATQTTTGGATSQRFWVLNCPAGAAVGPSITYNPAASSEAGTGGPVNFTGVTTIGTTGIGTISATPSGGSGGGTTTVGSFVLSGANAANFTATSAPTLTFTAGNSAPQNITLTCTSGAAARTANLQATEIITGGAASQRFWVLNCPAGVPAGPATCVWNPGGSGPDNWTNPAKWSNCAGGSGPGPGPVGTPGAPDSAQIDLGTVTLDVPVSVNALIVNGGVLTGDQSITAVTTLTWTGGTLRSSSSVHALIAGSGATTVISGGQKYLDGRTLSLRGASNRWTTGLIEMSNGASLQVAAAATLEIEPNAAEERIYFNNTGAVPTISNAGTIVKKGPNTAGFDRGINFTNTGALNVENGRLRIRANGTAPTATAMTVSSGATLEFSAGTFSMSANTAVSGNGALEFGDTSANAGAYIVTKCLATNGPVVINNAALTIGCGALQTFHELRLNHPAAILQGSAQFAVASALQWPLGRIRGNGSPAATITINNGATATWGDPGLIDPRVLDQRDYINLGTTNVSSFTNQTVLNDGARVVNAPAGTFILDLRGGSGVWLATGLGSQEFLNQGTLRVVNGRSSFYTTFTNTGSVFVENGFFSASSRGELVLHGPGNDTGSYTVAELGYLRVSEPTALRALSGSGSISGEGQLQVVLGGQLSVSAPTHTIRYTSVGGDANTLLDFSTGATVVIRNLGLLGSGGTITGSSPIEVTGFFNHDGGTVTTTAAGIQPLTLSAAEGGGRFNSSADKTYRKRALVIASTTTCNDCGPTFQWHDGNIKLELGASITVDTEFYSYANDSMLCAAPCTSALNINGLFVKSSSDTITIGAGITINQAGQFRLLGGNVNAPPFTQTAGSMEIDIASSLSVTGGAFTLAGGTLFGRGVINGNLINTGGLFYPSSSLIIFTINGNYTQGTGGTLQISTDPPEQINGSDKRLKAKPASGTHGSGSMDRVNISGTATLGGTLDVVNGGGIITPPRTFLTALGGRSGTFSTYTTDYPELILEYQPTEVRLVGFPPVSNPVVTSVADPGDGICDVAECTLREAIDASNRTLAADIITFNIPGVQCTGSGGTCEIHPLSPLPKINTAIAIDGYTQPGANANTSTQDLGIGSNALIKIEIDGTVAGGIGLDLAATGNAVSVEGLAITDFATGIKVAEVTGLENGVPVAGAVNSATIEGDFEEYTVVLPSGITSLNVATSASTGDVDLYVRYGAPVSLSNWDCRPYDGVGDESCDFNAPAAGVYYVRVYGYQTGPLTFNITATWLGAGGPSGSTVALGGNYLGLHADGSAGTQVNGLLFDGIALQLGDGSARSMNVISGNQAEGVLIAGSRPSSTVSIQGNLIGTAPNGTSARPNQYGIKAVTSSNILGVSIGGAAPQSGNVIARNTLDGIHLFCDATADVCFDGMQILGNYIGTNALGAILGNLDDGIAISNLTGGQLSIGSSGRNGANVIHHNGGNGIETDNFTGAGRMSFLVNRISGNGAAGIDLANDGPTANDPGDEDTGPNLRQNFPDNLEFVLAAGGGSATITWEIDTPIGSNYPMRVDFYKQTGDEHDIWLGTNSCGLPVRVSCSGSITFPAGVTMAAGDRMAAIVTDSEGRSSEAGFFAAPLVNPVVNSVADPGTGSCDASECTLREAIAAAELTPAADTISFAIPAAQCGSGTCVIAATANLPIITTPIFIDGYTQPGAAANTRAPGLGLGSNAVIKIELNGGAGVPFSGFGVSAPGALVRIEGLAIHSFNPYQIFTNGDSTSNVNIGGNYLGLKADGSLPPPIGVQTEIHGIQSSGGTVQIGDGTARRLNVISGSPGGYGIDIRYQPGNPVIIVGNLIGTAPNGVSARPNIAGGVRALGSPPRASSSPSGLVGLTIGGNSRDLANVIGHNGGDGMRFECEESVGCFSPTTVLGNFVGVGINNEPMANAGHGIHVDRLASGQLIFGGATSAEANVIANNVGAGIRVALNVQSPGDTRGIVSVLVNRTANNGGLGVDVLSAGRNANDPGDVDDDSGPQNFPNFTSYTLAPGGASASFGYGIDTPSTGTYPMRVDFYRGQQDELGEWLGTATCGTTGACSANITFPTGVTLSVADSVVAIATDARGRSSEASFYQTTTSIVSDNPDPSEVGTPYTVVVDVSSAQPFQPQGIVDISDALGGACVVTLAGVDGNSAGGSCQMPSTLPVGSRMLFASYPEVPSPFVPSVAFSTHQIVQTLATSTSIVTISPTTTVVGQAYTVTVNVISPSAVNQGIVSVRQLHDNATCQINLAVASSCQLTSFNAITTAVRASYAGVSGNFGASQSSNITHVVDRASTAITILTDSPDPSTVNQPITVTMSLAVLAPGAGTPTGNILVTDGTASCGVTLPNLSCTFVPKALGAGTLEARYLGDANFNASTDTEAHTITVDGADLSIVKFNGLRLVPGGSTVTYSLLVSNAGPQAVVNARVNDILPSQLSNASWTCSASNGASCPAAGLGTVDTLVSLPANSSLSFALTVSVQASPEQIVVNRATVSAPANSPDPALDNNESVDTDLIGFFGDGFETETE